MHDDRTSELNRTDANVTAAVDPIPLTSGYSALAEELQRNDQQVGIRRLDLPKCAGMSLEENGL